MLDVDPRLQLSDLTDYQFQASLAQYNTAYNTNDSGHGTQNFNPNGYYQPVPDTARTTRLTSRISTGDVAGQRDQTAYYQQQASTTDTSRTNPRRSTSNLISVSGGVGKSTTATSGTNPRLSQSQSDNQEIKDPTNFVPPHMIAPLRPDPPSLKEWRNKFFNIEEPLLLTEEQYLTYFPHVDNVYSHRSTQKYKRKPFVSHYWDCRLKGRPTGTPMNKKKVDVHGDEQEPKKRKRKVRERDLCDVKIKVTEFFGMEELEALRKLGMGLDTNGMQRDHDMGDATFALNGHQSHDSNDSTFGVLEPTQNYPQGHPGANGKKWYMVQRVDGNDKDGEEGDSRDLDHKHTLEESDRIKKSSVQRWLLAQEKEKKKAAKVDTLRSQESTDNQPEDSTDTSSPPSRYHATGLALQTLYSHSAPTSNNITFYGCSFCPFAQRVWLALEFIGIPYHYVEVTEHHWHVPPNSPPGTARKLRIPELEECNPEGKIPCLKHNNFAVWESQVMLEYLEDLAMGQSLFQPAVGNAQLKAHSRLWVDFINRRILPVFYALLLLPDQHNFEKHGASSAIQPVSHIQCNSHANSHMASIRSSAAYNDETYRLFVDPTTNNQQSSHFSHLRTNSTLSQDDLVKTLHTHITTLVNASHRTGPYFLGPTISYVDIAFAPWIIRLWRVLGPYRGFPRPEVGSRWQSWVDAIERDETVRRTVSEEESYRVVYGGAGGNERREWNKASGRWERVKDWTVGEDTSNMPWPFPEIRWVRTALEGQGWDGWMQDGRGIALDSSRR